MTNFNNLLLDYESFSEAGIELSEEEIDRAVEYSDPIRNYQRQWQTYLDSLAFFGFITWLESRDRDLKIDATNCSVKQSHFANYINGVFNLRVGEYKICLLTNGVAIDEFITVDRALVDLPVYIPHFYVLVDVVEEQKEVKIDSFISYQELIARIENEELTADLDWTYNLPVTWFNSQIDDLLLQLRCLQPNPLPQQDSTGDITSQLEPLLSQLTTAENPSQVLTWSQAAPILGDPNLLSWLEELQTTQPDSNTALSALQNRLSATMSQISQTAINVKSWLNDELDELAQNLAWTLLPAPALVTNGLRDLQVLDRNTPTAEFQAIVTQLRNSGEEIPENARGACQDFDLGNVALRLFAITWTIEETPDVPEWSLLLVLGAKPDNYLPQGLKLEVKEGDTVLDEKAIATDTADSYLYTQVIGELEERFIVSIALNDGTTITFPHFMFN